MITKIFLFILIYSILIIFREIWALIKCYYLNVSINISTLRLISLGLAISYVITIIITGFKI